jgi:tetratricopeptide (TPR) repeat protein
MLTGLLPPSHAIRDNVGFALASDVPTIAEQFRRAGYATAAFVSGYPLHRRFGLARGFDLYDDRFSRGDDPTRAPYLERRADLTVRAAIAWLADRGRTPDRPFFAWLHLFDPHAPYDPPEPFRTRFRERPYDGEVAFADSQIGALLDDLSRRDALSHTVVLAIADHGEGLGEHGEPTHGLFIYDSTIRIPLIVAGPGVKAGGRVTAVVRATDVAPTALDLGSVAPIPAIDGRSLKPALEGRSMQPEGAYAESLFGRLSFGWAPLHGWRTERTMFIDAPTRELYDLVADPGENRNLSAERRSEVTRYAGLLGAITSKPARSSADPANAETRERLRALGYTGGAATGLARPSLRDPKDFASVAFRAEQAATLEVADPSAAEREFRAILNEDPDNVLARQHLALVLSRLRRYDEALAEANRLVAAGDRSSETLVLIGECDRVLGRYDAALRAFDEAAARDPLSAEPLTGRGRTLTLAGRRAEAQQAFGAALVLAPDDADALAGLADLAIERGDMAEARARLETLRTLERADPAATLKLGVLLVREGDLERAIALFREVVVGQPANVEAVIDLGGALAKAGRAPEAIPYFERATAADARNVVVWNSLAMARLESGNRAGAIDALRRSLQVKPGQPDIAALLRKLEVR